MNKPRRGLVAAALLVIAVSMIAVGAAGAALQLSEPGGHVNDFAGMLSNQTVDEFEAKLTQYEKETGNEIAVVTVENLQGTTIEDFAVRLFEKWQIGKKDKDNGALLLVAEDEREMRIEVGYGLEPDLTDAESHLIINNVITPAFKAGDFDKGVREGVDAIVSTIAGEEVPAMVETESRREPGGDISWFIYIFGFVVFGGLQWVGAVLARTKSWWLGGLLGFLIGLLIAIFSVVIGIIAIIVLTSLGLLLDFAVSHAYQEFKKGEHDKKKSGKSGHVPWWAGGGWGPGGGGRSGGGFGGFGGGRSGGGGASGGW